jgi:acetoin utilization deacetylase AcuC-like enzyme
MTSERTCAVFTSPEFLGHDTGQHPENPSRIAAILSALEQRDLLSGRPTVPLRPTTPEVAARVHEPRYLDRLMEIAAHGGAWVDADTLCASDSLDVAYLSAGAAVCAVEAVVDGSVKRAFAMSRPPGHHATKFRAMGFCLMNNIAIAAQRALDLGLKRLAIVDWDVHHGNGTQDIFYDRSDVLFISIHQHGDFYPGTGASTEQGVRDGEGYTLNIPLRPGATDLTYLTHFSETVEPALRTYEPEMILISAGFDAHERDPLGSMRVSTEGFAQMATKVRGWADELCDGRVVSVLEGGYDLIGLSESVCAVLEALD